MTVLKRITKKNANVIMILTCFIILFYSFNIRYALRHTGKPTRLINHTNSLSDYQARKKYILLWTSPYTSPFTYFGTGNNVFIAKKCKWNNCYVTSDRQFLGDYSEFDVVAFHGPELLEHLTYGDVPRKRSPHQKYVYANIEAASNYPLCTDVWNDFFNWTWTYKLNSDAVWGYFAIRNASNHVIGPSKNINWIRPEDMDEIDEELKQILRTKHKPAAWFASNCMTQSLREKYVEQLQRNLKKFGMEVNIYGKCGVFGCPKEIMPKCLKHLEKSYYFYLAFENAVSDDYVTERIIYALNHNTVPIVFGGANYSRFMPDGAYVNAYEMKPSELAVKMAGIIKNRTAYYNYFRWKKYYSYHFKHESPDTDDYCKFCSMINNAKLMRQTTIYKHLNKWWTGSDWEKVCYPTISNTDTPTG